MDVKQRISYFIAIVEISTFIYDHPVNNYFCLVNMIFFSLLLIFCLTRNQLK